MSNGVNNGVQRDRPLIEGVVANLPLFWSVSPAQRQVLAAGCWSLSAARGASLLQAGSRPPGLFAVAYGAVKLALRNGGAAERLLRVVAARQTFAEASALLGRPAPYDAVAITDAKLVVIPSAALLGLLERETGFAKSLINTLAEGHLQLCAEIGAATLQRGAARLAGYLDALVGNGAGDAECTVELPLSKTLVAARLGMKKETLSRLLRQLGEAGVIAVSRRSVLIRDRGRLQAAASGHRSAD
ncbi:MAG TPA: Crp/Fnr family transcriptional regulator [Burkholderiales bacterium]|nr:Crp/Fnr family transcriptional regulator [Burkholderiales bacterium]